MFKILIVHGGLGNQMFAYAFSRALKKRHPFSYISLDMLETWNAHNGYELLKVFSGKFSMSYRFYRRQWKVYSQFFTKRLFSFHIEREADYCTFNAATVKSDCLFEVFDGFWQSEKYFRSVEKKIRQEFSFDMAQLNEMSLKLFYKLEQDSYSVSVHIRRGDYKEYEHYFGGTCDLEYYQNAILYIKNQLPNVRFYFFSDDMNWVKEKFKDLDASFVDWNIRNDSWQDMFLMTKCKNNIIANSSFSWWGAWLNNYKEKIVVAPKKWFKNIEAKDIVPEQWIRI